MNAPTSALALNLRPCTPEPGASASARPWSWPQLSMVPTGKPKASTAALDEAGAARAAKLRRSSELLDAIDELSSHRDPDALCQSAVTVARQRLGLQRTCLFLVDQTGDFLCGTWGTNASGETVQEHHVSFPFEARHHEVMRQARSGGHRWAVFADGPLLSHLHGTMRAVTHGYTAMTPLFGREGLLGFLVNGASSTEVEVDHEAQMSTAVFCRMLGGRLDDIARGSRSLPWESVLTRRPFVARDAHERLALSATRVLHAQPTASNQEVADECRVSTSHLNAVFRKVLGLSLREYRNRLRVERFFTEVAPEGGNLLPAALKAGFGSYAQFHRVFREMLGSTPREHLSARVRSVPGASSAASAPQSSSSLAFSASLEFDADVA